MNNQNVILEYPPNFILPKGYTRYTLEYKEISGIIYVRNFINSTWEQTLWPTIEIAVKNAMDNGYYLVQKPIFNNQQQQQHQAGSPAFPKQQSQSYTATQALKDLQYSINKYASKSIGIKKVLVCECGAVTAKTTHANWCDIKN